MQIKINFKHNDFKIYGEVGVIGEYHAGSNKSDDYDEFDITALDLSDVTVEKHGDEMKDDIVSGTVYTVTYDGAHFQLSNSNIVDSAALTRVTMNADRFYDVIEEHLISCHYGELIEIARDEYWYEE